MNLPSTCRGTGRCPIFGSTLRRVQWQTMTDSARPSGTSAAVLCHHRLHWPFRGHSHVAVGRVLLLMGECSSFGGLATKHTSSSVMLFGQFAPSILGSGLSVTKLFNLPLQLIVLFFHARLAARPRAQLSRSRHKCGSWLPVFDHELAHRCRAVHVGRAPEVLHRCLNDHLCCHQARGTWMDPAARPAPSAFDSSSQPEGPRAAYPLFVISLTDHVEGRYGSSTQVPLSFGSTSGFTFS